MRVTGKNAIAALVGGLAAPLIGIVMTPFYLRKIGLEGLGLVGLMSVITAVLGMFIAGATKTYQRELSSAQDTARSDLKGLVVGGMLFFTLLGVVMGLTVLVFGLMNVDSFIAGTSFTRITLTRCIFAISFLLLAGVLSGAIAHTLTALRDLVLPTKISIFVGIITAASTWVALSRWPSVDVFYFCQVGGAVLALSLCSGRLIHLCRRVCRGHIQAGLSDVWRGRLSSNGRLTGVLILQEGTGIIITQIDRILVTTLFPLAALGAYNLGANTARMTTVITSPINMVAYPEICGLVAKGASKAEIGEYISRVSFVLCMITGSILLVLLSSGHDILNAWLGEGKVPPATASCLIILSAGHLLLAVAGSFYNITVAYGRVGYGIPKNILSIVVLPFLGSWFAMGWGLPGVALVWLIYGIISVIVCSAVVFRRHGDPSAGRKWWLGSIAIIVMSILTGIVVYYFTAPGLERIVVSCLAAAALCLLALSLLLGGKISRWFNILEVDL